MLPRGQRTVSLVMKRFRQDYAIRGERCPVAEITLRRWIESGIVVPGIPDAAVPFIEIARKVDEGSDILKRLGGGGGISDELRTRVLDDLVQVAGDIVRTDQYKAHVLGKPSDMTALMGKLVDAERGRAGSGDLNEMLGRIDVGVARGVVEGLLGRFPVLVEEIRAAMGDK